MSCPPRWATPRNPDRRTLGPRVGQVAAVLGQPFMPWQQQVADVALELDDDDRLAYREVRITVPRQSGKTTLLLALMVHRALGMGRAQRIAYTAQTRNDAREKWTEHVEMLDGTPLTRGYTVRRTNGSEAIRWRNGSRHVVGSGTAKAGHGYPLDLGVIDEAFAQVDWRLEQAFLPAMITRPSPQLYVVSTMGTAESVYLNAKVDDGRARIDTGAAGTVAYFEWSAPDDADLDDPATWHQCMPALGHTVAERDVAAAHDQLPAGEFARAFGNRRTRTTERVIAADAWDRCADRRSTPVGPIVLAVDVAADRAWSAICAAGHRRDGAAHIEVLEYQPGTGWVADRLAQLVTDHDPYAVAWDPVGPTGSLDLDLERVAGATTRRIDGRDQVDGCGALYDAVAAWTPNPGPGQVRHMAQEVLDDAIAGAARRTLLDAWAWARRTSQADICPLVAATEALWALHTAPERAAVL